MQKITVWMLVRLLLLATIGSTLNGCGTKGPLYIPEKQYPQETPAKK
jgi:predicted small lipoprotein YifL